MQKESKQTNPKKQVVHFDYDWKKKRTEKFWVDKGTELVEEFITFCKAEGI